MTSTIYTIGTALGRARDHEVVVSVLVGGHWIDGLVNEVDGHGVVLTGSESGHHVVRIQDISAVRVHTDTLLADTEPDPWEAYEAPTPLVGLG
jgi:hypothetical protein